MRYFFERLRIILLLISALRTVRKYLSSCRVRFANFKVRVFKNRLKVSALKLVTTFMQAICLNIFNVKRHPPSIRPILFVPFWSVFQHLLPVFRKQIFRHTIPCIYSTHQQELNFRNKGQRELRTLVFR